MRVRFYISSRRFSGPYAGCLRAEGDGTPGILELVPFDEIGFPQEQLEWWRSWYDRCHDQVYKEFDRYVVGKGYPQPLRPWLRSTILEVLQWKLGYHLLAGEVVQLDEEQPLLAQAADRLPSSLRRRML